MPYIASVERIGIEKGIQQGMQQWESALLERQLTRRFGPHSAETLQRGGSAQPWPVRPFLEIAFDEVSIVAAVTANQAEAKAGEVIAPSSRPSGLVTRQTARIARRLDLICAAAAGSSTGKSASGGSAEDDEH